jgi:protein phosphatase
MADVRLSQGFPLAFAVRSDVGLVRANNEDSHGSVWLPDGTLLIVVCDGMGGHEAGEVASGLAVDVVREAMTRNLAGDPRERIYEALQEANAAIVAAGQEVGRRGMGTTAIVTLLRGNEAFVGLVGDSRLFHVRAGHLLWRTLDHTRVQHLLDRGIIREDEARDHPDAGMLTRALGHSRMSNGKPLVPEVIAQPLVLEPGDALVLSTDGLHDLVDDWEIAMTLNGEAPGVAVDTLVSMALERGGHDNVTVAVATAGQRASAYDPAFASQMGRLPELGALPAEDTDTTQFSPDFEDEEESGPVRHVVGVGRPVLADNHPVPVQREDESWEQEDRLVWVAAVVGAILLVVATLMLVLALMLAM